MKKRNLIFFNVLLLVIFMILSTVIYILINDNSIKQNLYIKKNNIDKAVNNINKNIFSANLDYALNLSKLDKIQKKVSNSKKNINIKEILESVKEVVGADIVYILDKKGDTIVSSTFNKRGETLLGKNYKFRPYFIEAIRGNINIYPAVGVTTHKRGLYFAVPIYTKEGFADPNGVIVIKTGMERIDSILDKLYIPTILVSDFGVVFSSSRSEWLYKTIKSHNQNDLVEISKTQQYGEKEIEMFPFKVLNKKIVDYDENKHIIDEFSFFISGWKIYSFFNTSNLNWTLSELAVFLIMIISLILFLIFISYLKYDIFAKEKLERKLNKYKLIVEQSPASIVVTDTDGKIEEVNPKFEEITGYNKIEVLGKNPRILKSDKNSKEFYYNFWKTLKKGEIWKGELFNKKKDGSYYWESSIIAPLKDKKDNVINYIAIKEDITERKELEEQLKYYASTDEMTKALNRRSGLLFLKKQISLCGRNEQHLTIAYLDIDELKYVNDNFGHDVGDELIREMVNILNLNIRVSDTVTRLGGDEFLLIFPNCEISGGEEILRRVYDDINIKSKEIDYPLSVSFGFAQFYWDNPSDLNQLISEADKNMYRKKILKRKKKFDI